MSTLPRVAQAQRPNVRDFVKGKKAIARGKFASHGPKSAADSLPVTITSPLQNTSTLNHGPGPSSGAPFTFTAYAEAEVDHRSGEDDVHDDGSAAHLISDEVRFNPSRETHRGEYDQDAAQLHLSHRDSSLHQLEPIVQNSLDVHDGSHHISIQTQSGFRPAARADGVDNMDSEEGSGGNPLC